VFVDVTAAARWRGRIHRRWEWWHWQCAEYIWWNYCRATKRRFGSDLY